MRGDSTRDARSTVAAAAAAMSSSTPSIAQYAYLAPVNDSRYERAARGTHESRAPHVIWRSVSDSASQFPSATCLGFS
eukprot:600631-Rhodomonas_salina.1